MYGLDFLGPVNLGEKVALGKKAVIVGGGNVAMDAARAALRMGAKEVTVVYRRGRAEMPALPEEITQAEEEGVKFELLTNPVKVLAGADGRVRGLECLRMTLGEPDASGRRRPVAVEGSNFTVDADNVIIAIGQTADIAQAAGVPLENGKIAARSRSLATKVPGVFAGGDVVLGPASLVEAMAHGHHAAEAIDAFLRGKPMPALDSRSENRSRRPIPIRPPHPSAKQQMSRIVVADRTRDFREIDLGYTAEQAVAEAKRCLACGLCSECGLCVKACGPGAIVHDMQPTSAKLRGRLGDPHARLRGVPGLVARRIRPRSLRQRAVQRAIRAHAVRRRTRPKVTCNGHPMASRSRGSPSSNAWARATAPAAIPTARPFAACPRPRKPWSPWSTSPGLEVSIFCMDVRAFGKEFDSYVNRARDEHGVKFIRAIPSRIVEMPGSKNARIRYFDDKGEEHQQEFDLVVLSVGMRPSASVKDTAAKLGLDLNRIRLLPDRSSGAPGGVQARHLCRRRLSGTQGHSRIGGPGVGRRRLRHGKAAAVRGTMIQRHEYPWERDVTDEKAARGRVHLPLRPQHRIGGGREGRRRLGSQDAGHVCHTETNLYTCSDTSQQHIKDVIREASGSTAWWSPPARRARTKCFSKRPCASRASINTSSP